MTLWLQVRAIDVTTWDREQHVFIPLADAINRAIAEHVHAREAVEIVPALSDREDGYDRALLLVGIPCADDWS